VKGERSVLLLSVAVAFAGLVVIGLVIGLVVLLDPVP
jgi:hypothetical protein